MDLLDPSCVVSTDRKSWWMRYREGRGKRERRLKHDHQVFGTKNKLLILLSFY